MKPGLLFFVFISSALHAAVLLFGNDTHIEIADNSEQGGSRLTIELTRFIPQARQPVTRAAEALTKPLARTSRSEPIEQKTITTVPQLTQLNPEESSPEQQPDQELENRRKQNRIDSLLKTEFKRYFFYPNTARRKNWQGDLVVSFVIHRDGRINNIVVTSSSGYSVLDHAAVQAVSRIQVLPTVKELALDHSIEKNLPVSYRLN